MESRKEALANFVSSLSPYQLQLFDELLQEWEGEGDECLEIAGEYAAVALKCREQEPKDINNADAT